MTPPLRIPVAGPSLSGNEKAYVAECLETSWISSVGRFIGAFEQAFAAFCNTRHAIACSNGTTALHLALMGLGVAAGDEVIVPDLTYIAAANAVSYCGARPVFVDCDARTFNIDPARIEAAITPRTRGIVAVHLYGQACDMDPILEIARRHGLFVLEDAAEAHGATYKGRRVGSLGDAAAFSFFGNKIITTGEGGAVTLNDDALAERLRLLKGQGMQPDRRYWFPIIGYNYRMTNVAAAIGLAQLERVQAALDARAGLARAYDAALAPLGERIVRPFTAPGCGHVFWMYTVMLGEGVEPSRDQVMARLDAAGIETRPVFYPMHALPPYAQAADDFPNAVQCSARGINLPTHAHVTADDVARIATALAEALDGTHA